MGEASTGVLHTIGEETDDEKETQVTSGDLYTPSIYTDSGKLEDDGIYEDVDTTDWKLLGVIQEESDSDYYRSVDYCNTYYRNKRQREHSVYDTLDKTSLRADTPPKLQPKRVADKIYDFKKDFSNHHYANIDHEKNSALDRRTKNEILRQKFFAEYNNVNKCNKNEFNDKINRLNEKKAGSQGWRDDAKTGDRDKAALNLKLFDLEKYNRVLTTTETYRETSEASFTSFTSKTLNTKADHSHSDTLTKRSETCTSTRRTDMDAGPLNNSAPTKGQTEIRITYNPILMTSQKHGDERCLPGDEARPKLQLTDVWREDWLNILLLLAFILIAAARFIDWLLKRVCSEDCHEMT